jgi:hypothetical protein
MSDPEWKSMFLQELELTSRHREGVVPHQHITHALLTRGTVTSLLITKKVNLLN